MSTTPATMSVWAGENLACIRIVGRANLHSSMDFKTLVNGLRRRGCEQFTLELSECSLMDSTFLGVLTGFGLRLGEPSGTNPIELLNPNRRITELLESLGVLHLFQVRHGPVKPPHEAKPFEHTPIPVSKTELNRTCLEAHHALMEVNPGNILKFKDVAKFLAEDLKADESVEPH